MPAYLQGADISTYGASNATPAQINQASSMIDAFTGRREGLLWAPDANGYPAYMLGLTSTLTLTLSSAIAPGKNVTATLTGPVQLLQPGSVLITDISVPASLEALVVVSILNNTVTFQNVQFSHGSGTVLQEGLTITEQRTMPQNRPLTQLSRTPVVNVISGVGRYGYTRRGDDGYSDISVFNLLAVMTKFGGPPAWELFSLGTNSLDPNTGQIWVPAGVLLAYYTEVRIHYVAGWQYSTLPSEIKQACANIANAIIANGGLPGTIEKFQAGDTSIQFNKEVGAFNSSIIDDDTKILLQPYKARVFV